MSSEDLVGSTTIVVGVLAKFTRASAMAIEGPVRSHETLVSFGGRSG